VPSSPKAFRANYFPIAGAPALAAAAFRRWVLDGQATATTANKTPESAMIPSAVAKCASLNGSSTYAQWARASN